MPILFYTPKRRATEPPTLEHIAALAVARAGLSLELLPLLLRGLVATMAAAATNEYAAMKLPDTRLVRYVLRTSGRPITEDTCECAAFSGDLPTFRWAVAQRGGGVTKGMCWNAARSGVLPTFRWAVEQWGDRVTEYMCKRAARSGDPPTFRWAVEQWGGGVTEGMCDYAAWSGNHALEAWAREQLAHAAGGGSA